MDRIHRSMRHPGGRFALADLRDAFAPFRFEYRATLGKLPQGVYAAASIHGGTARILYRSEQPRENQRHAVARAVGAVVLFGGHIPDLGLWRSERGCEAAGLAQTDAFARLLLLPVWALEEYLAANGDEPATLAPSPAIVSRVARFFDVPCCMSRAVLRVTAAAHEGYEAPGTARTAS